MKKTNVLIVGSGPAGLTAAIYAARANLSPILLEGGPPNLPGGQLMITTEVENFPGFEEGIQGPVLMDQMRKQALRVGTEIISENAVKVDLSQRPFRVWTDGDGVYEGNTLIISTGASAKWLGLPEEAQLYGKGVSACATCDGFFFRGKDVIVVGGGDTAMEEATFLTNMANSVTVVHRRDKLRASAIMQKRALEHPKIKFVWDSAISQIHGHEEGKVTHVTLRNLKTDAEMVVQTHGIFVAIGHTPNTKIFAGQIRTNEEGYILTKPGTPRTSVRGVFAAGDVQDLVYKQAITAAASGCMAAMEAERFLADEAARKTIKKRHRVSAKNDNSTVVAA